MDIAGSKKLMRQVKSVQHDAESRANQVYAEQQAAVVDLLAQHQKAIQQLQQDLVEMHKTRAPGGGFPWSFLLLAGGAYALYRMNPTVQEKVQGLYQRVNPGIQGNLTRAADAVSGVVKGENPDTALETAGGEVKRAGEKAADQVADKLP